MNKILSFFREDLLFSFSLLLALFASTLGRFDVSFIDFKVILSLFGLMTVIKGLEQAQVLTYVARQILNTAKHTRILVGGIWLLSLFSSMILTNDVAILTLMPIYLKITKRMPHFGNTLLGAVMIIVFANLGSSFFPFGNPQNLFLFSAYSIHLSDFFHWTASLLIASLAVLAVSLFFVPKQPLAEAPFPLPKLSGKRLFLLLGLLFLMILAVFGLISYLMIVPFIAGVFLLMDRPALKAVDYRLLATFICFFLIVGNVAQLDILTHWIHQVFNHDGSAFIGSIVISQFISNVPAAILVEPFTDHVKAVLLGVNIGGLGTLVASLANLIGYKLIKSERPEQAQPFFRLFTKINFLLLALFTLVFYFFL